MKKGFTFIEILVVVTIIAILMAVGLISYSSVNKRSRDAKRKSDIEQIRTALEMYRADYGYYPDAASSSFFPIASDVSFKSALSPYLSTIPQDPKDDVQFPYQIKMINASGSPVHYYGYCVSSIIESIGSGSDTCAGYAHPDYYNYTVKNP